MFIIGFDFSAQLYAEVLSSLYYRRETHRDKGLTAKFSRLATLQAAPNFKVKIKLVIVSLEMGKRVRDEQLSLS